MRALAVLLLVGGCVRAGFDASADGTVRDVGSSEAVVRDIGAKDGIVREAGASDVAVTHLQDAVALPGAGTLIIDGQSLLDTTAGRLDGSPTLPPGTVFDAEQTGSGPQVLVIAVDEFVITQDAVLRVVGVRPLVIVARKISIQGVLDGSARLTTPGAGGAGPGLGPGAGGAGTASGLYDSGGAGGGYGTAGGAGGPHTCSPVPGGAAGAAQGDPSLSILVGGSGGGAGSPGACNPVSGGAGGGAIQLSASASIAIDGTINVGGGGGGGGPFCNGNDGGGGSGGGSGGAIYIEAPLVQVTGALAANGGGGGAGGGGGGPAGSAGADATTTLAGAVGGTNSGGGATGGTGGWRDGQAAKGEDGTCSGAAGGGGGAVGRIAIRAGTSTTTSAVVTPAAVQIAY